jgi:hypothetical protein
LTESFWWGERGFVFFWRQSGLQTFSIKVMQNYTPLIIPIFNIVKFFREILDHNDRIGKEKFEKVFDPVFFKMIEVHKNYTDMFSNLNLKLNAHFSGESINFNELRLAFNAERQMNDHLRMEARQFSNKILEKCDGFLERDFAWSIIAYFLDAPLIQDNELMREKYLEKLIVQGSDAMIDTPSYLISSKLEKSNDVEEIIPMLNNIQLNLGKRFGFVTFTYHDLKLSVYKI